MVAFEQDYAQSLEAYLEQPADGPVEGLRDVLFRAFLLCKKGGTQALQEANRRIQTAPYAKCMYSGLPAVQLLTRHAPQLEPKSRAVLLDFLHENVQGWQAEFARGQYDSYRLLAAVSLVGTGLLTDRSSLREEGLVAIREMLVHCRQYDLPDEYISPVYTAFQLASLAEIRQLPLTPCEQEPAAALEDFIWQGVLRHFVPGYAQLIGPYSRAYSTELCGFLQADMAAVYRLLGSASGISFARTLWNPAYADCILPHGTLDTMKLDALYFASFSYRCEQATLHAWSARAGEFAYRERTHTAPSSDRSIKRRDQQEECFLYPAAQPVVHTVCNKAYALGWADAEAGNGMACSCFSLLYNKGGNTKACFLKLARDEHYIGQWNHYNHLDLDLSASNFPDEGRKTVQQVGDEYRVTYTPRAHCADAHVLRLGFLFPEHFSQTDMLLLNGSPVSDAADIVYRACTEIVVLDGNVRMTIRPLANVGTWRIIRKNHFLNVEWLQEVKTHSSLVWRVGIQVDTQAGETNRCRV